MDVTRINLYVHFLTAYAMGLKWENALILLIIRIKLEWSNQSLTYTITIANECTWQAHNWDHVLCCMTEVLFLRDRLFSCISMHWQWLYMYLASLSLVVRIGGHIWLYWHVSRDWQTTMTSTELSLKRSSKMPLRHTQGCSVLWKGIHNIIINIVLDRPEYIALGIAEHHLHFSPPGSAS